MIARAPGNHMIPSRNVQLLITAAVLIYAAITAGGIVCITGSGQGCPGWPRCDGQVIPPMRADALIEYIHRFIAALTAPMVIVAAIVGWRSCPSRTRRARPAVVRAATATGVLFAAEAAIGLFLRRAGADAPASLLVLSVVTTSAFWAALGILTALSGLACGSSRSRAAGP